MHSWCQHLWAGREKGQAPGACMLEGVRWPKPNNRMATCNNASNQDAPKVKQVACRCTPVAFQALALTRGARILRILTMASCSMRVLCQARPAGRQLQASGSRPSPPGQRPLFSSRSLYSRPAAQQLGNSKLSRCSGGCLAWLVQTSVKMMAAARRMNGSDGARPRPDGQACLPLPPLPLALYLASPSPACAAAAAASNIHKH